jgi:hypothetical protein
MKKVVHLFLSILFLSGCAITNHLESTFEKNNHALEGYNIEGSMVQRVNNGLFSQQIAYDLTVYINNERVIKGPLHHDGSGEVQGIYKSKIVVADCGKPNFFSFTECEILVDKQRAGRLSFEPESLF